MESKNSVKMDQFNRIQEAKLIINSKIYPIFKGVNTIGRNKTAVINIKNVNISQNHALIIVVDENQHFISDFNSSNGTYIRNSKLIPCKLYELTNNTEIKFGDVVARYSKITSTANSTINLASQTMDMTQNMTQNFYAANTQLMDTISEHSSDHNYFNSSRQEPQDKKLDFHEIATQQLDYPEHFVCSDTANQKNIVEQLVEENVDFNVHEAPTQVINIVNPKTLINNESNHLEEQHCVIDNINIDLHGSSTQVVKFPSDLYVGIGLKEHLTKDNNCDSNDSEATQVNEEISELLGKASQNQKIDEKLSQNSSQETIISESSLKKYAIKTSHSNTLHYSQEPSTSGVHHKLINVDDSLSNSPMITSKNVSIEETVIDTSNDSVDFLTMQLTQNDSIEVKSSEKSPHLIQNKEENGSTMLCQDHLKEKNDLGQPDKEKNGLTMPCQDHLKGKHDLGQSDSDTDIDDAPTKSLTNQKSKQKAELDGINKLDSNEDSDTDVDEPLKVKQNFAKIKGSEKQSNSSQGSDVIRPKRKLIPRLPSDTEAELSQDNEVLQKSPTDNLNTKSDQNENTQDIGFRKKPLKQLLSDDDIEDIQTSKSKGNLASDSDTDIEDDLKIIAAESGKTSLNTSEFEKSNNNLREEVKFNDSDCIPATQDVLADVFGASTMVRDSGHQSSEDSFKLGITELMEDLSQQSQQQKIQEEKGDKESTQPLILNQLNNTDQLKVAQNVEEESKEKGPIDEQDDENDVYMMATQKICDKETTSSKSVHETQNDDIYLLPTQQISNPQESESQFKTPKKFNFKKKKANLDGSLTTILATNKKDVDDDDVYMVATQKINETQSDVYSRTTQKIEENDFYLRSTQPLNNDDDFYAAATQKLNEPGPSGLVSKKLDVIEENEENLYLQSTQCLTDEKKTGVHGAEMLSKADKGIVREKEVDNLNGKSPFTMDLTIENDNAFDLPTQAITENENCNTQQELEFLDQNVKVCPTNRPENPLAHILDKKPDNSLDNNDATTKNSRRDSSDLFDIPKNPKVDTPRKSIRGIKAHEIEEDRPETLSQIAEFIKKPIEELKPKTRQKTLSSSKTTVVAEKKHDDEDRPETLSQIEAFIKKPSTKLEKTKLTATNEENNINKEADIKNQRISKRKSVLQLQNIPEDIDDDFELPSKKNKATTSKLDNENKGNKIVETVASNEDLVLKIHLDSTTIKGKRNTNKNVAISNQRDSKRKSTRNADEKSLSTLQNSPEDRDNDFEPSPKKSKGPRKLDKEENQANKSTETVKSDVDQSFVALLEAKTGRVKKKSSANLGEIQVTATSNRRSMGVEEMSATHLTDLSLVQLRKTRNTSRRNVKQPVATQNKRKVEVKGQNKMESDDDSSGAEFSSSEIPSKILKTSRSQDEESTSKKVTKQSNDTKVQNVGRRITRRNSAASNSSDVPKIEMRNTKNAHSKVDNNNRSDTSEERIEFVSIKNKRKQKTPALNKNKTAENSTLSSDMNEPNPEKVKSNTRSNRKSIQQASKLLTSSSEDISSDTLAKPVEGTSLKTSRSARSKSGKSEDISSDASTSTEMLHTPKRGQKNPANETLLNSAERSKRKQRPKVVFTMLDSPQLESLIKQMGGSVVDSVDSSTVLITEHVKRSQKLLTAIGQGKPICAPNWLQSSKKAHEFLDPWDYILLDKEAEKKWDFSLKESLLRASNKKLLVNFTFQLMVSNAGDVLKGAIEACGGKCVTKNPSKNSASNYVIVASPDQKTRYSKIVKQYPDVKVVEPEAIFDGVLRQELRLSRHFLS